MGSDLGRSPAAGDTQKAQAEESSEDNVFHFTHSSKNDHPNIVLVALRPVGMVFFTTSEFKVYDALTVPQEQR